MKRRNGKHHLRSSEEQRNYYLDNAWISYQRQERVKFKFICYRLDDWDHLARQMRLNPDQFSHLQLQFSMASVKSQTRETKIRVGNIVSGDLASNLLKRMRGRDFVLLKAAKMKSALSSNRRQTSLSRILRTLKLLHLIHNNKSATSSKSCSLLRG